MLLQILFRTQGVGCCYGFVLNERTGKCDSKYMKSIHILRSFVYVAL